MKKLIMLLALAGVLYSCDGSYSSDGSDSSSGTGGSMARFACIGDYLYTIDENSLSTFNISDSSKIVPTSHISANWSRIETIFPKDSLLFLGSRQGMYIYNLKNPAKPEFVYLYTHIVSCDPVVVQGKYAFVTLRSDFSGNFCNNNVNLLEVIDVSKLTNPRKVGSYNMENPRGLGIDGTSLFVCDGMDLLVMNATNPLDLKVVKRMALDGTPFDVIAKNGILTLSYSSGVKQYAYSNDTIQEISTIY